MKFVTHAPQVFCLFLIVLLLSNYSALAQKTTIWVVRHAEKAPSSPDANKDPDLSDDGKERANALAKELKREHIKAIYVTQTKRSAQTANPLAIQAKILPRVYTDSLKGFAKTLLTNFRDKKVLMIAHSNTVMPLLEALGAERPLPTLSEEDFDMIFKVTIKDSGSVDLEVFYYGALHHTSELPDRFQPNRLEFKPFTGGATHF